MSCVFLVSNVSISELHVACALLYLAFAIPFPNLLAFCIVRYQTFVRGSWHFFNQY